MVTFHIPVRATESHGVNLPVLTQLIDQGMDLLLTCDTGIAAHEAVAFARSRGVAVIITDHHDLAPTLPEAAAVVNPKRLTTGHPLQTLPGVGVAYKLIEEEGKVDVPEHLKDGNRDAYALGHGKGYKYPHNSPDHFLPQQYLPDKVENLGKELIEVAEIKTKEINEAYEWLKIKYSIFLYRR